MRASCVEERLDMVAQVQRVKKRDQGRLEDFKTTVTGLKNKTKAPHM